MNIRRWYRGWVLQKSRRRAALQGEIWFDKYERQGPYHWSLYYDRKDVAYRSLVDTVTAMVPPDKKVLDLGCGDGVLAHRLAKVRGCRVTGVDLHPLAISFACSKCDAGNCFEVGSVYEYGNRDDFDVVTAVDVFEHLAHPDMLLANAARVLKKDGVMVISTPLADAGKPKARFHVKEYAEEEFRAALNDRFQVTETRRVEGERATVVCRCVKREA